MPSSQSSSGRVHVMYAVMVLLLPMLAACGSSDSSLDSSLTSSSESPPAVTTSQQPLGQWSPVIDAPIVQVHLSLLVSGKVLSWGGANGELPYLWDPATGAFTEVPAPSNVFCAGHGFLPDGRLFVAGGHISADQGTPDTNVFDPATGAWQALAPMAQGRWYPTNTTLPSGEVLTMAGRDENGGLVLLPEVWNGAAWRQLTSAPLALPYYPRNFVAPDGRIFYAGEGQQSYYLDVAGAGRWTDGPRREFGSREYGSAVMYEPGKILYTGGGDPPTASAEIIDLNQPGPTWTFTGEMEFARRQMNATLLPTGDVLVTGGTSSGGFNDPAGGVLAAELWHPATGTWTTMASSAVVRVYHSTALLLPDGRVLYSGSGDGDLGAEADERSYELYSPPYLFNGARPTITGALPSSAGYGQTQVVNTPDGPGIAQVNLIRLGSVTHAFDQSELLVPLSFSPVAAGLTITFPSSRTAAPPGPYMLFLVNANGVPSVGRMLLLQ